MADPVLVPPTPVINQSDSPEEIKRVGENIQAIFDRVVPEKGPKKVPSPVTTQEKPVQRQERPQEQAVSSKTEETRAPETKSEPKASDIQRGAPKVPSFIEKALTKDEVKPEAVPKQETATESAVLEEWSDDLPAPEKQTRIKGLRDAYKTLKEEVKTLKERPAAGLDEATRQKLEFLENKNKEMSEVLSRTSVEHHAEFQNKIIRPMNAAWTEAARIVHETGGNPDDLAKALALSGKAHFEALDEIFSGMPESAKIEANNAIAAYRRSDAARRAWLENAPKVAEQLKRGDLQRQYQQVESQRAEMKRLWDEAGRKLREEAKVEIMQKSDDPDAGWWNEQADRIEKTSEDLFLNNTDMEKVAFAMRLAPMVDPYRKLWLTAREEVARLNGIIREKFGSEPSLTESGGNVRGGAPTIEEDLKKPFTDVFLREFHKQRNAGVR